VPKAEVSVSPVVAQPTRALIAAPQTIDNAVTAIASRLAEVDAVLETVPALKAERKRLRRMLAAAAPKHAHGAKAHQ
jgi:hypothetical protein